MSKKEIEDYIDNELNTRLCSNIYDFILWIIVSLLFFVLCYFIIYTFRDNSDVDERNKKLDFCDSIYKSDGVILEQCKDYFIIHE